MSVLRMVMAADVAFNRKGFGLDPFRLGPHGLAPEGHEISVRRSL